MLRPQSIPLGTGSSVGRGMEMSGRSGDGCGNCGCELGCCGAVGGVLDERCAAGRGRRAGGDGAAQKRLGTRGRRIARKRIAVDRSIGGRVRASSVAQRHARGVIRLVVGVATAVRARRFVATALDPAPISSRGAPRSAAPRPADAPSCSRGVRKLDAVGEAVEVLEGAPWCAELYSRGVAAPHLRAETQETAAFLAAVPLSPSPQRRETGRH